MAENQALTSNQAPVVTPDDEDASFKTFLYNPKNGTIMGRTSSSWAKILFFYLVFYALLAAFFAIMLAVFMQTIDDNEPKFSAERSIMFTDHGDGFGPGLSVKPAPSDSKSTLYWLKVPAGDGSLPAETDSLVKSLKDLYAKYDQENSDVLQGCNDETASDKKKACEFDTNTLAPCDEGTDKFGYANSQPCITLQLNRIFGWTPEPFAADDLPLGLTNYLKDNSLTYNEKRVYFSCDGEDPVDRENIGVVEMSPKDGIPLYFFPYYNQPGYLSPLVAVKFRNPQKNVLISVLCQAYAKNIPVQKNERLGSVRFELFIEE